MSFTWYVQLSIHPSLVVSFYPRPYKPFDLLYLFTFFIYILSEHLSFSLSLITPSFLANGSIVDDELESSTERTTKRTRGEDEDADTQDGAELAKNAISTTDVDAVRLQKAKIQDWPSVILEEAEKFGLAPQMLLRAAKLIGDSPLGK